MKAIFPSSTMARMEPWCPSAIERAMERPMPKLLPFLCASALALSLTACAGTINNSTADTASNVTFTFTDSGVTAAGETDTGYEIDGTALTITSSGTYTVSGSCADEFTEALKDLKSRNMRSLVIDLRNNPGGSLDEVVKICSAILEKGQIIVSVGEEGNPDNEVYKASGSSVGVPLAILVNEHSASASEIMAGAVQDNQAGVIVGTKTFGKGVVQTTIRVEKSGGWLKLTTDAYFTPNGRNIHGEGITPDIQCDLPDSLKGQALSTVDQSEDAQLWAALDYVREQADAGE